VDRWDLGERRRRGRGRWRRGRVGEETGKDVKGGGGEGLVRVVDLRKTTGNRRSQAKVRFETRKEGRKARRTLM
jgi:hypothetical protein